MPIQIACACGKKLNVRDELAGKKVKCPACGGVLVALEEAVTVGRLVRILQFEGGKARLVEVTLADDAAVIDQSISELELPRDSTLVAIVRDEHVVMPRGDTILEAGDEVLAMVTPDSEDDVRRLLTGT